MINKEMEREIRCGEQIKSVNDKIKKWEEK